MIKSFLSRMIFRVKWQVCPFSRKIYSLFKPIKGMLGVKNVDVKPKFFGHFKIFLQNFENLVKKTHHKSRKVSEFCSLEKKKEMVESKNGSIVCESIVKNIDFTNSAFISATKTFDDRIFSNVAERTKIVQYSTFTYTFTYSIVSVYKGKHIDFTPIKYFQMLNIFFLENVF